MVTKPTLRKVREMIERANPEAAATSTLQIAWSRRPKLLTYPTGAQGWYGEVVVACAGWKTRTMLVDADDLGTTVR